eukprot:TRINITY_DN40332_c0_g1_i1.p1 TRINITY_DN40332_c0_g1~~TRINITY_DN40332_c0_g1_i1.p1  ORF type:complete len:374 (+),score=67.52 TRINITY_DN40332_c0_g1_i1:65-1186(+)
MARLALLPVLFAPRCGGTVAEVATSGGGVPRAEASCAAGESAAQEAAGGGRSCWDAQLCASPAPLHRCRLGSWHPACWQLDWLPTPATLPGLLGDWLRAGCRPFTGGDAERSERLRERLEQVPADRGALAAVRAAVEGWAATRGRGAVVRLSGTPGSGAEHAARAVGLALSQRDYGHGYGDAAHVATGTQWPTVDAATSAQFGQRLAGALERHSDHCGRWAVAVLDETYGHTDPAYRGIVREWAERRGGLALVLSADPADLADPQGDSDDVVVRFAPLNATVARAALAGLFTALPCQHPALRCVRWTPEAVASLLPSAERRLCLHALQREFQNRANDPLRAALQGAGFRDGRRVAHASIAPGEPGQALHIVVA